MFGLCLHAAGIRERATSELRRALEVEDAMDWFERAIEQSDVGATRYTRVGLTKILRGSPRWAGLMRMMKLHEV